MTRQDTIIALDHRDERFALNGELWGIFPMARTPVAMPMRTSTEGNSYAPWPLTALPDDGTERWLYTFHHPDHGVVWVSLPALDHVTCTWRDGGTGQCVVAHRLASPPHDLYSNPRHGGACECCGRRGAHTVRRDGAYPPACRQ